LSPNVSPLSRLDAMEGPLSCADIWSFEAYATARRELVTQLISLKRSRRVRVGEHCSLVFESRATVWFQIHEELHLHLGDREARARELLAEYAHLVPTPRELRASLFLECTDSTEARSLSEHLALHIESLSVHLPVGRFCARPLECLTQGIPGVAFLRFVRDEMFDDAAPPAASIRWPAPAYLVIAALPSHVVGALLTHFETHHRYTAPPSGGPSG
jgi:hypothetical protein